MTRGAAPNRIADDVHCPSTYVAGVFNRLADDIAGRHIENESIVNLPDWQSLSFRPVDGDWIHPESAAMRDYVQELDIRRGILTRRFRVQDSEGRRIAVAQRRAVSMADPYLAMLDCTVVAENWSGGLVIRSGINGRVANVGVRRYAGLSNRHLVMEAGEEIDDDIVAMDGETTQSRHPGLPRRPATGVGRRQAVQSRTQPGRRGRLHRSGHSARLARGSNAAPWRK